jgi:hypothetical protein
MQAEKTIDQAGKSHRFNDLNGWRESRLVLQSNPPLPHAACLPSITSSVEIPAFASGPLLCELAALFDVDRATHQHCRQTASRVAGHRAKREVAAVHCARETLKNAVWETNF